jgi:hypothetical protein
MKKKPNFTRLDQAGETGMRRLLKSHPSEAQLKARWSEILGPYLSRKLEPSFRKGGLDLVLKDPSCRKAVEALLPQIEKKLREVSPSAGSIRLR